MTPHTNNENIYFISGMWCGTCAKNIKEAVSKIESVKNADLNFSNKLLIVTPKTNGFDFKNLIEEQIKKMGFSARKLSKGWVSSFEDALSNESQRRIPWWSIATVWFLAMWSSMFAFAIYLGGDIGEYEYTLSLVSASLGLPAIVIGAIPFGRAGIRALVHSKLLTLDFFIFIGGISAFTLTLISLYTHTGATYADSGSMILAILLTSKKIENVIFNRTTSNILNHLKLSQNEIELYKNKKWTKGASSQIKKDEFVRFRKGETVAFDGVLESQEAEISTHLMSGEDSILKIIKGDSISAGIITNSNLVMKVTHAQGERKIDEWAEKAIIDGSKTSNFSKLLTKIESSIVTFAFSGAIIISLISYLRGDELRIIFETFFVGILIFCPCLFASILPLTKRLAYSTLLKNGITLNRSEALFDLTEVENYYFDKTGTLEAVESSFIPIDKEIDILPFIKTLSEKSTHPILRNLKLNNHADVLKEIKEVEGMGVKGVTANHDIILIGKDKFLEEEGISIISYEGAQSYVSFNGKLVGFILSKKSYDLVSKNFIKKLYKDFPNIKIKILSGDPKADAGTHLQEIDQKIEYIGNLSPEKKMEMMDQNSLFVGDGLNDTLALSKAKVSIRLGHRISGFVPADLELKSPDLNLIIKIIHFAKKFKRVLIQTGCAALIYNLVAFTFAGMGGFSPLGAVVSMLSSFLVMLISVSRLNFIK